MERDLPLMANALKAALRLHLAPNHSSSHSISPLMPNPSEPDEPPTSAAYAACYKVFLRHRDSLSA